MNIPDYVQCAEDHQTLPVVVQPVGIISEENFFCIYKRISLVRQIIPCGSQWALCIHYSQHYAAENGWSDFQTHRKVVGLVTITDCLLAKTFEKLHVQRSCMAPRSMTLGSLSLCCMGRWPSSRAPTWPSIYEDCRVVEKKFEDFTESLFIMLKSKCLDCASDNLGTRSSCSTSCLRRRTLWDWTQSAGKSTWMPGHPGCVKGCFPTSRKGSARRRSTDPLCLGSTDELFWAAYPPTFCSVSLCIHRDVPRAEEDELADVVAWAKLRTQMPAPCHSQAGSIPVTCHLLLSPQASVNVGTSVQRKQGPTSPPGQNGALTSSSIHPDTGTDTGRAQKFLSPEDTTDKPKGATPFYSSVRMPVTELEVCSQTLHVLAIQKRTLEASKFLQNAFYFHLRQLARHICSFHFMDPDG
ncbi:trafficking protein particle complex subunit 9-like isoform X4 [Camelus bactrianus]|uniref:Trafficking protein particle complex subunit 9-like isoform X4 n=2 Tax=Camelus bactrianus TaxID=9837 RepID=A0AC58QAS2_CAMBA